MVTHAPYGTNALSRAQQKGQLSERVLAYSSRLTSALATSPSALALAYPRR